MQRQDARKPDAALLPARKLMRIEIEMGLRQTDLLQDLGDARVASLGRQRGVNNERLLQGAADGPARVERIARVLVAILQPGRHCAALARWIGRDVLALEHDGGRRSADGCRPAPCRAWTCRSPIRRRCRASRPSRTSNDTPSSARTAPVFMPSSCAPENGATALSTCRIGASLMPAPPPADGVIAAHLVRGADARRAGAPCGRCRSHARSADGTGIRRAG